MVPVRDPTLHGCSHAALRGKSCSALSLGAVCKAWLGLPTQRATSEILAAQVHGKDGPEVHPAVPFQSIARVQQKNVGTVLGIAGALTTYLEPWLIQAAHDELERRVPIGGQAPNSLKEQYSESVQLNLKRICYT